MRVGQEARIASDYGQLSYATAWATNCSISFR